MKSFTAGSSLALALTATLVSAAAPDPGPEWTTTLFLDDFEGEAGSLPNENNWIIDTGTQYENGPPNWGTGEIQTYTRDTNNLRLDGNGNLYITPQRDSNGAWTSARIETVTDSFVAPEGGRMRVEAFINAPAVSSANGLGYWPAFWVLGNGIRQNNMGWPGTGEVDIMEVVNGEGAAGHGMHCGTLPGGPCMEPEGIYQFGDCPGSSCSGNWHTYTMIHDRTTDNPSITLTVDGQLSFTIDQNRVGADAWNSAINNGMYVLTNLAMGGALPDGRSMTTTPTDSTEPGIPMIVDYIAVWATS